MSLETINKFVSVNSQSLEALYLVEFGNIGFSGYINGGVVVLETGRVFGGDSGYYYIGDYKIRDGKFTGKARIVKHNKSWNSAFGDNSDKFEIDIIGEINEKNIIGTMMRLDMPGHLLPIRFIKLENLP